MPNAQQDSWLVFVGEFLHPCVSFVVVHAGNNNYYKNGKTNQ